jgi:hypothetical protein
MVKDYLMAAALTILSLVVAVLLYLQLRPPLVVIHTQHGLDCVTFRSGAGSCNWGAWNENTQFGAYPYAVHKDSNATKIFTEDQEPKTKTAPGRDNAASD